jgi:hypothetical protein
VRSLRDRLDQCVAFLGLLRGMLLTSLLLDYYGKVRCLGSWYGLNWWFDEKLQVPGALESAILRP